MTHKNRTSTLSVTFLFLAIGLLTGSSGCAAKNTVPLQCLCDCPPPPDTGSNVPIQVGTQPVNGSVCNVTNCQLGCETALFPGCHLAINGTFCQPTDAGTGQ